MQANLAMEYSVISIISGKLLNVLMILFVVYVAFKKQATSSFDLPFIFIMLS
jgi:hypothetical protein